MFLSVAAIMSLVACNGNNQPSSKSAPKEESSSMAPTTSVKEKDPNEVSVFVMTGQSNMEGKSRFSESNINSVFTDLEITDGNCCITGIEEVQTSFFGQGYDQIYDESLVHASNNETGHKIEGKFLDTKGGMGDSNSTIGPELGAAYAIKDEVDPDNPVYFIKCGISGSGFAQSSNNGDKINWNIDKEENLYVGIFKTYTDNCLQLIKDAGKTPVIKGFMWNQGESDAYDGKIELYNERFNKLFDKFKEDYAEYAPDGDGDNIALLDALIYEGGESSSYKPVELNNEKLKNIEEHDNYYYVDATNREGGLGLTMQDSLHYDLKSMFRLGMAYGQAILDNDLLD